MTFLSDFLSIRRISRAFQPSPQALSPTIAKGLDNRQLGLSRMLQAIQRAIFRLLLITLPLDQRRSEWLWSNPIKRSHTIFIRFANYFLFFANTSETCLT